MRDANSPSFLAQTANLPSSVQLCSSDLSAWDQKLVLGFFEYIAHQTLRIKQADFKLNLVNLEGHHFFNTLRNKLMWGADKRF